MSNKKYYLGGVCICLLVVVAMAVYYLLLPFSRSGSTTYIYIDNDDTEDSVFHKLSPHATERGLTGLHTLVRHSTYGAHVLPGRYAVNSGDGALTVFRRLKRGMQEPVRLTIPSVRGLERIASIIGGKMMVDSASVMQALRSEAVCRELGFDTLSIPALFIPDTYQVYWTASAEQTLQRLHGEWERFWQGHRDETAAAIGMTRVEVATLASIVDEETAIDDEKPRIAGMYVNRLRLRSAAYPDGMPLQADPTVKYALGNWSLKRIYHDMLNVESAYNTYRRVGLPPGPIRVASVAAIDAVLHFEEHDYLYMCAKEDFSGRHNFAHTYEEHLKNAARWTRALNERGIK